MQRLVFWGEAGMIQQLEAPNQKAFVNILALSAKAGSSGATVLRMHTAHLERLARHDQGLERAFRKLAFHGLSTKLAAQLEKAT